MGFKRIAVFCGARKGNHPQYELAAQALGRYLADNHIELVYGGGNVGLMGTIADAMLARHGKVIGVIPNFLMEREVAHLGLTQLIQVETMHERKATIAKLVDGFIAMPGGIGTLDELCEMWTWSQLKLHQKPLGLLNTAGYFDQLVAFLDQVVAHGFMPQASRNQLQVADDCQQLLDLMRHSNKKLTSI